ncbi:MAG: hypothetical protein ACRCZY_03295 [Phocaeicola sp.]
MIKLLIVKSIKDESTNSQISFLQRNIDYFHLPIKGEGVKVVNE